MEWVAYCVKCREVIKVAPNGNMVSAYARNHAKNCGGDMIVGYYENVEEKEPETEEEMREYNEYLDATRPSHPDQKTMGV